MYISALLFSPLLSSHKHLPLPGVLSSSLFSSLSRFLFSLFSCIFFLSSHKSLLFPPFSLLFSSSLSFSVLSETRTTPTLYIRTPLFEIFDNDTVYSEDWLWRMAVITSHNYSVARSSVTVVSGVAGPFHAETGTKSRVNRERKFMRMRIIS